MNGDTARRVEFAREALEHLIVLRLGKEHSYGEAGIILTIHAGEVTGVEVRDVSGYK